MTQEPAIPLERQMAEAGRYYVCGVIENATRHDLDTGRSTAAPMRWADVIEAATARQAEDMARDLVHDMIADGRHGNLWVAGVYQVNIDMDGNLGDPALVPADAYARYVNPDLTD